MSYIKQLLDEVEHDIMNYQNRGLCYLPKPPIVNTQCVVYLFQCGLCDANHVGYTARHLHQRIGEHRYSGIWETP